MRSFLLAAAASAALVAAQLRIETVQNLVVCQPALLTWSGGQPPYFPAVIPGGQPTAAALKDFGTTSANQLTWTVDLAAGTEVSLRITDSSGAVNYAERVTIRAGSNTNCIGSNSTVAIPSGAAASGSPSGARASGAVSASASGAASPARSGSVGAAASSGSASPSSGRPSTSVSGSAANAAASSSGAATPGAAVQLSGVLGVVAGVIGLLV